MCKTILLISGHKRTVKDFVSNIFNQEIPNSVVYSMASPLKDIIATSFGITLEELEQYDNESIDLYIKQIYKSSDGEDAIFEQVANFNKILRVFDNYSMKKHFGESVLVDYFLRKIFSEQFIIISDWRSNIEYQKIASEYSKVITVRVHDDNIKNSDTHISETELDTFDFDYTLDNTAKDSTIVEQVRNVLESFIGITIRDGAVVGMNSPDKINIQNYNAAVNMGYIK